MLVTILWVIAEVLKNDPTPASLQPVFNDLAETDENGNLPPLMGALVVKEPGPPVAAAPPPPPEVPCLADPFAPRGVECEWDGRPREQAPRSGPPHRKATNGTTNGRSRYSQKDSTTPRWA